MESREGGHRDCHFLKISEIIVKFDDFSPSKLLHFWVDINFRSEALKGRWGWCKPKNKTGECCLDSLQPLETIVHNFIWSEKHFEETEICDILIYTLS